MCLAACSHSFQCGLSMNASILKWTSRRKEEKKSKPRQNSFSIFSEPCGFSKGQPVLGCSRHSYPPQHKADSHHVLLRMRRRAGEKKQPTKNGKQAARSRSCLYHKDHPVVNYLAYLHPWSWERKLLSASLSIELFPVNLLDLQSTQEVATAARLSRSASLCNLKTFFSLSEKRKSCSSCHRQNESRSGFLCVSAPPLPPRSLQDLGETKHSSDTHPGHPWWAPHGSSSVPMSPKSRKKLLSAVVLKKTSGIPLSAKRGGGKEEEKRKKRRRVARFFPYTTLFLCKCLRRRS